MTATIYGFRLVRERDIPELKSRARLFSHVKTGAQLLSLENDDENKVFGITFRTPCNDSTGVAHILEHSVLCGSRKYPVKEPFVELLKGSLKTFLNAFTYPDKTCYPIASQNLQDLNNLVDVYLDAVFYPRLTPSIFEQEGWHYELEDSDAPLAFKGVVFNEMKGGYSSPDRVLNEYSQQSLFPGHPYGVHSGGHPEHIPNLSYAQLEAFHQTYYHPSNARIFFYGDNHSDERLRLVDDYLKDFEPLQINSAIPPCARFDQPQHLTQPYPVSQNAELHKKGMVSFNWLLTETVDIQTNLALQILEHILIGTPASPLRKALLESGLGEDIAGVGLETELRYMFLSTGLKGIDIQNVDQIEALVLETLANLSRQGIHPHTVEAGLNSIEFRLRENNSGAWPQGLQIMMRSLTTWLYDADPLALLAFEAPLAAIKARLAEGEAYFENLIDQYLLHNPHRTTLIVQPDPTLVERQQAAEREHLASARAAMSQADIQAIIANTRRLKQLQQTPDSAEALASIPSLKLSDLDRQNRVIPLAHLTYHGTPVLYHDLFTNGIIYLDLGFDLHHLPQSYLPYVPLFGRALLETGTHKEDFVTLLQRISRQTGGIRPASFTSVVRDSNQNSAWLFLRSKAMMARAEELLAILHDVLISAHLDNQERFRQIVLEEKAAQEARLVPAGHLIIDTRLRARFNAADWAAEQMQGISYLFFLRQLARQIDSDWPAVLDSLETMRAILLNRQAMLCNVTLDAAHWGRFEPGLASFLSSLPSAAVDRVEWSPQFDPVSEGMTIPAQVNYVGKGADLYQLGYTLHGSALVIARYLRTTWLWERVRMQGGAYGAFCFFDYRSGVLNYLSYRDPNLLDTLAIYDQASQFLRQLELSGEQLNKSIIGAIGDMDAHQLPDARGYTSMTRYLTGDSDAARQRLRDEILTTTSADFRALADVLSQVSDKGQVVVLGSESAIAAAEAARPGWLNVVKVL